MVIVWVCFQVVLDIQASEFLFILTKWTLNPKRTYFSRFIQGFGSKVFIRIDTFESQIKDQSDKLNYSRGSSMYLDLQSRNILNDQFKTKTIYDKDPKILAF